MELLNVLPALTKSFPSSSCGRGRVEPAPRAQHPPCVVLLARPQKGELSKRVLVRRPIPKQAFANSLRDLDVTGLLLQKTRGLVQHSLVLQLRLGAQGRINLC